MASAMEAIWESPCRRLSSVFIDEIRAAGGPQVFGESYGDLVCFEAFIPTSRCFISQRQGRAQAETTSVFLGDRIHVARSPCWLAMGASARMSWFRCDLPRQETSGFEQSMLGFPNISWGWFLPGACAPEVDRKRSWFSPMAAQIHKRV